MRRIFPEYTYGPGPRDGCWWDQTCAIADRPSARGEITTDVVIIGAGFTGLSAALRLAEHGVSVCVLEAGHIGWGASGRNGGFCCLGGAKIGNPQLEQRFGVEGRKEWRQTEKAAVAFVSDLVKRLGVDVDRHSSGETQLAVRAKDLDDLRKEARHIEDDYGVLPEFHDEQDLVRLGMGSSFAGGLTNPLGFGLNPRKYVSSLATAAEAAGAKIYNDTRALNISDARGQYHVSTGAADVRADQVVIATNGYTSEDLPGWVAGRYMPTQSTVMVTRPLTDQELDAQGWTSDQMSYDTRNLLHYFRLMPDRRFLFGTRGGLLAGPGTEARARRRVRRHFEEMFPAWRHVENAGSWSGMVCLARDRLPYVGPVPDHPGMWAAMCYHGNGVAMGSLSGAILGDLIRGVSPAHYPVALRTPLRKFPLGSQRRILMPAVYAGFALADL